MTDALIIRGRTARALVTIEALTALLLAADNALGFEGVDLLPGTIVRASTVLCILIGLAAVIHAMRSREVLALVIGALLIGFVIAGPSGVPLQLSAVLITVIQTVEPFGFSLVAWLTWRRAHGTSARFGSLGMLLLSTVWAIGALAPIPLGLFLTTQILTITTLLGLVVGSGWRRLRARIHRLWDSAEIR